MTSCKYYDCGYCYAPKDVNANDVKGACIEPEYCPYLKSQMTEKEKIEGEIKVLQKKLSFLEELEKTKSPVEEAFKKVFGVYPTNEITYNSMWGVFQKGYYAAQEDYKVGEYQEPEENEWKSVALRFGEELVSVGPYGYYGFTPDEWLKWALNAYEKLADDWLSLLKKEKVKKSKINDLAEKLLPDDHPYKIADEHGETNPYKQYLNSVEDEKKMEELGFVKSSDGNWTARPLDWVKPQTPEQEPEMLLMRQGKVDIVDYNHRTHYRIEYTDSFSGVYKWFVRKLGEIPFLEEIRDVNVYAPLEELYQKEVVKQKDDHPYKIADEHGETNPLNSVDDEKKMEELGFVKNSDGNWTAQPLGETEPEEVKKTPREELVC